MTKRRGVINVTAARCVWMACHSRVRSWTTILSCTHPPTVRFSSTRRHVMDVEVWPEANELRRVLPRLA